MRKRALVPCTAAIAVLACAASAGAPASEAIEARIKSLVSQMTLQEKVSMTHGNGRNGYIGYMPGVPRLGIPGYAMTDGPAGVRNGKATALPAPMAVASSWNTDLAERVGSVMGVEGRAKGQHVLLAPMINILRVPHGGRSFESYGEDPYLVGGIAASFIKGVQAQGVAACAKHYAANNQETLRGSISSEVDERTLREIYLPAFKASVDAGVWSVMAAYNKLNGTHCSENDFLQNKILRDEWGFKGYVVSDWGATHSSVKAAKGGLDIEMPTGQYFSKLGSFVRNGSMDEKVIDEMVTRTLRAQLALDQWNPDWGQGAKANTPENQRVALDAAREGMVLLKNDRNALPIGPDVKSIAVIGPSAAVNRYCGGGSAWVDPPYAVAPLDAVKRLAAQAGVKVTYVQGTSLKGDVQAIPGEYLTPTGGKAGQKGLKAEYFDNMYLTGQPFMTRVDKTLDFDWRDGNPGAGLPDDGFSVRWTGSVTAPASGKFTIGGTSDDGIRIWVDNRLIVNGWSDHASETNSGTIELKQGKTYPIKVEYYENAGLANATLGWAKPGESVFTEAVDAARKADAVLVFVGTSSDVESEGFDRADLRLPGQQDALITQVAKANKRTAVVLSTGSAVLMDPWADTVPAILQAWFPGMEGGTAMAEVLFGKVNPSGKLPMTFPKRWEDSPAYGNFPGDGKKVVYDEGIMVGYRHFDTRGVEPLFAFGHGLSYTQFTYSDPVVTGNGSSDHPYARVSLKVTNTGRVAGSEVVQLYVKDPVATVPRPEKELKGFKKVALKPGESTTVEFQLDSGAFSFWSPQKSSWVVEPGEFGILLGSSSRDIRLKGSLTLK